MCWVDWIHDTQIWIETPFCKYHQEETKMCNGCSTVTCQCKPQRIPKVGEVWVGINDKDKRVVEAVTSKSVYYTLGSMPYGRLLQHFVQENDPPKPKPRELYIRTTNGILLGESGVGAAYKKEYADKYPQYNYVKFVEVSD